MSINTYRPQELAELRTKASSNENYGEALSHSAGKHNGKQAAAYTLVRVKLEDKRLRDSLLEVWEH